MNELSHPRPNHFLLRMTRWLRIAPAACLLSLGCENVGEKSEARARDHAGYLASVVESDVKEVRAGLPLGAQQLAVQLKTLSEPEKDPEAAKRALLATRRKVRSLRSAKPTFFAFVAPDGLVVRNDRPQDAMAGKNLFTAFPGLKKALHDGYAESRGEMHEARAVEGKPDGQWVAASSIQDDGKTRGLYVAGWAWSAYAYRLENALKRRLFDTEEGKKPLFYVFIVADGRAFGTSESPLVNAQAIVDFAPLSKLDSQGKTHSQLEITGRDFGLAVQRAPALGDDVLVAVLRSET